uniref:Craniofacial development protein 2 n=1 Tax=Cacopsylla melanoneura TaxID=428564 RepID=A0A8D8R0B9_9HEMI
MKHLKYPGNVPQASRSDNSESCTQAVCLNGSGGGKNATQIKRNKQDKLKLVTWNIRTLQDSKSQNKSNITPRRTAIIARELNRYNVDIAALQETHLKENGQIEEVGEGYTFIWSGCKPEEDNYYGVAICVKTRLIRNGTISHQTCINDRIMSIRINGKRSSTTLICCYAPTLPSNLNIKEKFYEELRNTIRTLPNNQKLVIAGDFNARVGKNNTVWRNVLGNYGIGKENENGLLLLQLCSENKLTIVNTLFKQKSKYKTTWQHPRSKMWHILDYFLISNNMKSDILRCKVMRGANCDTDHQMLKMEMTCNKPKFHNPKSKNPKYNSELLNEEAVKNQFQEEMRKEMNLLDTVSDDPNVTWMGIKQVYTKAAKNSLPKKEKQQEDWFNENKTSIEEILKTKQGAHEQYINRPNETNKSKYKEARSNCQKLIRDIKDKWWIERTKQMQLFIDKNDTYNLYRSIHAITGAPIRPLNTIQSKTGEIIHDKTEKLNRWTEYFEDLYNQHNPINLHAQITDFSNSPTLKDDCPTKNEIEKALTQLKNKKSPGVDTITAEMLKAGEHLTVDMFAHLFNQIWTSQTVPQDYRDAEIVAIHKKGDRSKCDNYRGISLLSISGKLLSRVIYNRLTVLAEEVLSDTQCGFRQNKSTTDMVFSIRQLIEKTLEQNSKLCIAFIDFTKAFDSVNRESLFKTLEYLKCPPTILAVLKSMHENTKATVKMENEQGTAFEVKT